jgi:hypothetical protein
MHVCNRAMFAALVMALLVGGTAAGPAAQTRGAELRLPVRLSAVAQDLDRGLATPIRITINRWSSDQVRDRLLDVLMTRGPATLLDALQDAPKVGSIGTTTSLAWDLHFARATPGEDGGIRIVLGTDRPIAFSEQWNGSRTLDYPFTVVELRLNNDGEGEGTLSFATKIIPDAKNRTVVLENWGTQRVRLMQVKSEKAD